MQTHMDMCKHTRTHASTHGHVQAHLVENRGDLGSVANHFDNSMSPTHFWLEINIATGKTDDSFIEEMVCSWKALIDGQHRPSVEIS